MSPPERKHAFIKKAMAALRPVCVPDAGPSLCSAFCDWWSGERMCWNAHISLSLCLHRGGPDLWMQRRTDNPPLHGGNGRLCRSGKEHHRRVRVREVSHDPWHSRCERRGRAAPCFPFAANLHRRKFANTPDNLVHWVMAPQSMKPRTAMPELGLTESQARDVAAYLYTLR